MTSSTAVVHLVRAGNGLGPLQAFLEAEAAFPAGTDHELILLLKGFADRDRELADVRALADGRADGDVRVPDDGFDVTAYLAAAEALGHERLCFLNSWSSPRVDGWLGHLSGALDDPRVGVAGATGSWASHRSFALHLLRLPNAYGDVLGDRAALAPAFRSLGPGAELSRFRQRVKALGDLPREIIGYPGFPAPHVRTNAFVLERELLLSLPRSRTRTKSAAYRFEGGTRGLTAQVRASGLDAVVVGRDGVPLRGEEWPAAALFWQRDQEDLLVSDNQTRAYDEGTAEQRDALARYAWGSRANPSTMV